MVVSELELRAMSPAERAELAAALAAVGCTAEVERRVDRRRKLFLALTAGAVVLLAAWIVTLGATLPRRETVGQWRTAWVGFDVALLLGFATCAWSAWRGRQILVGAALVTGTLLLCDAWFDVVLSWDTDERWWSVVSAAAVEVPLALLLVALARRLVRRTAALARARLGVPGPVPALHALALFEPMLPAATVLRSVPTGSNVSDRPPFGPAEPGAGKLVS